jgi:hypothetical protein
VLGATDFESASTDDQPRSHRAPADAQLRWHTTARAAACLPTTPPHRDARLRTHRSGVGHVQRASLLLHARYCTFGAQTLCIAVEAGGARSTVFACAPAGRVTHERAGSIRSAARPAAWLARLRGCVANRSGSTSKYRRVPKISANRVNLKTGAGIVLRQCMMEADMCRCFPLVPLDVKIDSSH